ncbi:MAG: septal ring lytic transglycosylase RlpA family protein, partial [Lewinella sp.]|nr:septal ring lytic transglycosylase RlpA family protein [Lewinella sp.]
MRHLPPQLATMILCLWFVSLLGQPMEGKASYYSAGLHGNRTSSGERYDHEGFTAASLDFPIGTILRVTRLDNGQSVEVKVNDCGPHRSDRIIDLSGGAAKALNMIQDGVIDVRLTVVEEGRGRMPCGRRYARSRVQSYDQTAEPAATTAAPEREAPPISGEGAYRAEALEPIQAGFGVQVGSYREYANAERQVNDLQARGFSKVLIRMQGNVHQVVLGPFETRESAESYRDNLRENYR